VIVQSRVRRILGLALTLLVAFLLVALVGGCRRAGWTVGVMSSASSDVIVRIEYEGGGRDSFLAANDEGDAAQLRGAPAHPTIKLLDAITCQVLASGDLPLETTAVGFDDGPDPGALRMELGPKDLVANRTMLPEDDRCAGR
jgi:hypothetical protein